MSTTFLTAEWNRLLMINYAIDPGYRIREWFLVEDGAPAMVVSGSIMPG